MAATPASCSDADAPAFQTLHLEVIINGRPAGLIGKFSQLADGRFAATARELEELGIRSPQGLTGDAIVVLDDMAGLAYSYVLRRQTIAFRLGDERRRRREIGPPARGNGPPAIDTSTGAVLNYALVGTIAASDAPALAGGHEFDFHNSLSAQLEGRLFGTYGLLASSAIASTNYADGAALIRLDSAWSHADPDDMLIWRVGDVISGGHSWTRPIRIGGAQLQRSFALRPDLITMPLPAVSGSAAVPSKVDVYINNVKAFSRNIEPGPFRISNLPVAAGASQTRVIVRDALGRESESLAAFYSSPRLLRRGLYDFSLEAGFARRHFARHSNNYASSPVASGSFRFGWSDAVTLEGHGEAGGRLVNGGMGANFKLGAFAVMSLAGSASRLGGAWGGQIAAAFETKAWAASVSFGSQRSLAGYADLATVTAAHYRGTAAARTLNSVFPARARDWLSVGLPLQGLGGNLSLALVNSDHYGRRELIASSTYSQNLSRSASLYVTGFADFDGGGSGGGRLGIYGGMTLALGNGANLSAGISHDQHGTRFRAEHVRAASSEPGSLGWRVSVSRGAHEQIGAGLTYQAAKARMEVAVTQFEQTVHGTAIIDGAVAFAGGDVFFANRIDDAFAVVDVGLGDVEVAFQNRPVGRTGAAGRILVPGLRAYERNAISVSAVDLPVDADLPVTRREVVPADRAGVTLDMRAKRHTSSAIVVLHDLAGGFMPVGTEGRLAGSDETFIVGYDGRAYLHNLARDNSVRLATSPDACTARFAFTPKPGAQVIIDGVVCR